MSSGLGDTRFLCSRLSLEYCYSHNLEFFVGWVNLSPIATLVVIGNKIVGVLPWKRDPAIVSTAMVLRKREEYGVDGLP